MTAPEDVLKRIKDNIGSHLDFPIKGIIFRDVFPMMRNPGVFRECIQVMSDRVKSVCPDVSAIVGLDARGFIFAPMIALDLNVSFVPVRKKGKLPGSTMSADYTLEYGKDCLEVQKDSLKAGQKVVIVDDLLATGGTMKAAFDLMQSMKVEVSECMVVIELPDLKGRDKVPANLYSVVQYEGH